jgi:hypothetical protein
MDNKVFLSPEGYIEVVLYGDQNGESFLQIYEKAKPLIDKILSQNKPLLGLGNLTNQSSFSLSSDKVAMEYLEKIPYDKMALYGVPHIEVTKGIIMAMGKSSNTKIFENRKEALDWLLEK